VKLLLDTCTFLWVLADARPLSRRARDLVLDPGNEVFLSAASAWEIALKHALGRLPLPAPPAQFVPAERERHGIDALSIDEESVLQVAKLPHLHRDPFDRVIVCQAIVHGMAVLTPDPLVAQYPVRVVW
jgi:PIN domain nuclease of toxin-antitoxin system